MSIVNPKNIPAKVMYNGNGITDLATGKALASEVTKTDGTAGTARWFLSTWLCAQIAQMADGWKPGMRIPTVTKDKAPILQQLADALSLSKPTVSLMVSAMGTWVDELGRKKPNSVADCVEFNVLSNNGKSKWLKKYRPEEVTAPSKEKVTSVVNRVTGGIRKLVTDYGWSAADVQKIVDACPVMQRETAESK